MYHRADPALDARGDDRFQCTQGHRPLGPERVFDLDLGVYFPRAWDGYRFYRESRIHFLSRLPIHNHIVHNRAFLSGYPIRFPPVRESLSPYISIPIHLCT